MRSLLTVLARALGTRPWLGTLAPAIVWADTRLSRLSRGRLSLLTLAGLPSLRLTALGRRSGLFRSTNLLYYPHGAAYVVVGSNWGRRRDPGWVANLRAHPDATVAVRGRETPVRARELSGDDYADMWQRLTRFWPGYAVERDAAGRRLPIFVLTPR